MTAVRTGVLGLVDSSGPDQRPQRSPAPPGPRRPGGWVKAHWAGIALLLPVLVLVGAVHAWGMQVNPQRLDDEGTYVSQAWAVMHWTTLAHYTYWYDHPPLAGSWSRCTPPSPARSPAPRTPWPLAASSC